MLQTGPHVAEAEGWLMTGMYFMAKIKEPRLRSATLTKMKRDSERKRERERAKPDKTSSGIQSYVAVIII